MAVGEEVLGRWWLGCRCGGFVGFCWCVEERKLRGGRSVGFGRGVCLARKKMKKERILGVCWGVVLAMGVREGLGC